MPILLDERKKRRKAEYCIPPLQIDHPNNDIKFDRLFIPRTGTKRYC